MGTKILAITSAIGLVCLALISCDTPVGQGAAWGAATGAIIGGAATGHVRAASIGAAASSLNRRNRSGESSCALRSAAAGWLSICALGREPGLYYSPYTGRVYNLRGVPPSGLTRDVDTGQLFRKP